MKYILSLQEWDPELAKWIQKLQVGCSNFGDPKTDDSCKKAAEFLIPLACRYAGGASMDTLRRLKCDELKACCGMNPQSY